MTNNKKVFLYIIIMLASFILSKQIFFNKETYHPYHFKHHSLNKDTLTTK